MEIKDLYNKFIDCGCKVSTDTRNILLGSVFFALKGDNFNGNKYALEALEKGCAYAIVDEEINNPNEKIIKVENTLVALQQLASFHRSQFEIPVLSITGTNGKTTTKELISSVLQKKYKTTYTKGNLNNHIGVPLTLLEINSQTEFAVVEMGANHPGEIKTLCEIAKPNFGIITNVGRAHLEGFGSFEGVVNTKTEMYSFIKKHDGKVFVNSNNPILLNHIEHLSVISYGFDDNADIIGIESVSDPFLEIKWKTKNEIHESLLKTNLVGEYNSENVLAAICVGNYFNICIEDINDAISSYFPSNNRSQILKTKTNTLLLDAYNANPTSMNVAIDNFCKMKGDQKIMILGDMLELGEENINEHLNILNKIKKSGISNLILVGKTFYSLADHINAKCFNNIDELREYLKLEPLNKSLILIKGSHGIHLEKIIDLL
jgi:UDP-N-acetylmuramoyl-tripeptide--D-alanyl-D-alanine ligase